MILSNKTKNNIRLLSQHITADPVTTQNQINTGSLMKECRKEERRIDDSENKNTKKHQYIKDI